MAKSLPRNSTNSAPSSEMVTVTVEDGFRALEYLAMYKPFSKERIAEASKSELRRWFDQGGVQINGASVKWDEAVFPSDVSSLILFPKGKRVTLL